MRSSHVVHALHLLLAPDLRRGQVVFFIVGATAMDLSRSLSVSQDVSEATDCGGPDRCGHS